MSSRIRRWHKRKKSRDLRVLLDDYKEFVARPYTYLVKDRERLFRLQQKDARSFDSTRLYEADASIWFLFVQRGSLPYIVGSGKTSVVWYSPDRVVTQFGYDQGVPHVLKM